MVTEITPTSLSELATSFTDLIVPTRTSIWSRSSGEIVVGMKRERASPREVEGEQALFVVNLPPRNMAGMVSEAMLFDIGYADGILPVLAVPESHVPDGTRAG